MRMREKRQRSCVNTHKQRREEVHTTGEFFFFFFKQKTAYEMKAVWQDNSLSKEQKQSKIADIRKSAREKINATLTPEQQAKFAELKEPAGRAMHRKEMGRGRGHRPFEQLSPPPPPEEQEPADSNS